MGGEVLQELRDVAADAEGVSLDNFRLGLAATAEVAASVTELRGTMNDQFSRLMGAIEAQNANIEIIKDHLESVEQQIMTCEHCANKVLVEKVQSNPAVRAGAWLRDHPKMAISVLSICGVLLLVLLTLWLDPGVRRMTFEFLKFPTTAVDRLTR